MDRKVRRKLAMAGRVLEFARANPSEGASWAAVVGRLEELLARSREVGIAELAGRLGAREARSRRRELRDRIHRDMVVHLVHTVEVAFREEPTRRDGFVIPATNAPFQRYIATTRALLAKALPLRDGLVAAGLGETLLDDLGGALEAFDAADAEAVVKRREHVAARQALLGLVGEVLAQVQLLDGLLRPRFRKDRELGATWETVRTVDGPDRAGRTPVVGAIGPAPGAEMVIPAAAPEVDAELVGPADEAAGDDGDAQDGEGMRDAV